MVCHRVINLTDTHFGNYLLGSYWKQIHKAGRRTPSMQPKIRYLLHGRKQNLKMLLGKKKSSLRASFQDVCCCFLAFWVVVVVVVLLSHVSTQPQTQTHYYVKYNMQTQNLKPYNLKIQHMENVNRWYGVRSCFHLLLPAVDARKRKKKKALFMCHPYTKTISKEPSSVPSEATDCLIQKSFKAQLQQCEKMNLKDFTEIILFFLWTWKQNHRHSSCDYCLFFM